jgi:hypothetical protein
VTGEHAVNQQDRSAFRAFVREHHPDRGGDPDVFVAGLARFAAAQNPPEPTPKPEDEHRYDAPVEVVTPMPFPVRVGVALIRTWHRRRTQRVE